MRLRTTAPPIFLVTVNPKRGGRGSADRPAFNACSRNPGRVTLAPPATARNSARFFRRSMPSAAAGAGRSGRQPLPPAGATGGDDLAAALRTHPSAETVPALAHEL